MDDNKKPNEDFAEQIRDQMRESRNLLSQSHKDLMERMRLRHEETMRMQRYVQLTTYICGIILVVSTFFATTAYWKAKQAQLSLNYTELKSQNSFYHSQKRNIQSEIDTQKSLENKLMDAMAWVLSDRSAGQEQCKNGVFASTDRNVSRAAFLKLEGVSYEMGLAFSKTINENLSKFRSLADVSKVNSCSKEGEVVSKELTASQKKIQFMILDSIASLEKQKSAIEEKINGGIM